MTLSRISLRGADFLFFPFCFSPTGMCALKWDTNGFVSHEELGPLKAFLVPNSGAVTGIAGCDQN